MGAGPTFLSFLKENLQKLRLIKKKAVYLQKNASSGCISAVSLRSQDLRNERAELEAAGTDFGKKYN